ncbi:crotonobetaine/carnitine-CoA ligase [Shewanella sp. WXL01]|uniref:crotonobetaine/carnitine-CoA ligase n=1 Tax=Shewanella sp. WXL01 TaxID=2709721 RepID=UPI0014385CF5|nr:crotonobetaine/carnitine-CoA ligase [Shewanella sp. WXL01]NKF49107.1 crotonobetaine/carnitine-CoA ligase [Shewanella sp. WXL01]
MDIVGNKTLNCMWEERARNFSDKTALVFEDAAGDVTSFTYFELNAEINKAANLFLQLGVHQGDRVAVQLHNSPQFIACWFGLAKIGAIIVPINTQFRTLECQYIIDKCAIKMVVIEQDFIPIYTEFKQNQNNTIEQVLVSRAKSELSPEVLDFDHLVKGQATRLTHQVNIDSEDVAEILFTSGTTSNPKGVEITHCNLQYAGHFTAWQTAIRPDDTYLTMMPSFHIDFQCNAAMAVFTAGAKLVMLEKYSARKFWKQICHYRATLTHTMPMILRTLMLQPKFDGEQDHCLRDMLFFLYISPEEKKAFEDRFNVQLFNSYGMTETLVGVIGDSTFGERHWPSIGRPGFGYEARVTDDDNNPVPANTTGNLWIKGVAGRTILKGYYQDEQATHAALMPDGWFNTGDKAYVDEDGWFYFVDRKTNMIKRSGENVSSSEVEQILMSHPYIEESAVIGVQDPIRDEAIKAFIIFKHGFSLTEEQILNFCRDNMAKFKIPSFIEIRDALPRTCTCKVQKKFLA